MSPQLQIVHLHRRRPAEQADRHLHLALVREHFLDRAAEVGERAFRDLDHLAGTWSEEEYQQFMLALREQRQIDPEMWK